MNADARRIHIHWRRMLFLFHLGMGLVARLLVGSLDQMPPPEIYHGFELWGVIVALHALLLAALDGRDGADLPAWMQRIIQPSERRRSLFAIDLLLWVMFTVAIANRVIPEGFIFQNVVVFSLLWLAHTGIAFGHLLLLVYGEVYDRTAKNKAKRKNTPASELPVRLALAEDGEIVDLAQALTADKRKRGEDA